LAEREGFEAYSFSKGFVSYGFLEDSEIRAIYSAFSNPSRKARRRFAPLRKIKEHYIYLRIFYFAEREGFEPSRGYKAPASLAKRYVRPL
jgi:hypothetical protein